MPLERLQRHLRDLLVRLAQELLARRQQHLLVLTLDLDLRRQNEGYTYSATLYWLLVKRCKIPVAEENCTSAVK